jgi:hypothetical protein
MPKMRKNPSIRGTKIRGHSRGNLSPQTSYKPSHNADMEGGLDRIKALKKTRSEGLNGLRSRTEASLAMTGKLSSDYSHDSWPFKWGG